MMADALRGGIVINEVLADPNGAINFDTDGSGTANSTDEYVELYNTSSDPIDISGLQLWDAGVGHWFTFPAGTVLPAGGHAMVMSGVQSGGTLPTGTADDLFFDAGRASALINNGGDNITLLDPDANGGAGEYIQATFNGDALDTPTTDYAGFPSGATRVGSGEDFGNDTDGQSLQRDDNGGDTFTDSTPTPGTTNVCFADGTLIATPQGDAKAEDIQVGDLVTTLDHGPQAVRWVLHRTWSVKQMQKSPSLAPVTIAKDTLGPGLPTRDLRVSQQHRILVRGPIAQRMFGSDEVLVPAKVFVGLEGVTIATPKLPITYIHLMLSRHEVLLSDGLPSESLYLGQETLRALPAPALAEIETFFDLSTLVPASARPLVKARRGYRLLDRHQRNDRPFLQGLRVDRAATT
jgi:hypothetical protein